MEKKINIKNPIFWNFHRSGWKFVVENLKNNFHNPSGIYLTTHFETHVAKKMAIKKPWVGFLHNTPNHPDSMKVYGAFDNSLDKISKSECWEKSKSYCRGLLVFSNYCKKWIEKNMFENVESFFHPTEFVSKTFDLNKFLNTSSKIVSIGHWMRNFDSFYELNSDMEKIMLVTPYHKIPLNNPNVKYLKQIKNQDYDDLLCGSVVFLDLFDASANNVVIECMVRNTPVLTRKLEAVQEYLGSDYPLYFSNLKEAEEKIKNKDVVIEAHNYLKNKDKKFLKIETFINEFYNSKIYQNIQISRLL